MSKKILLVLFGIICLASVLRLYKLAEEPPGLTWDEAALGYNAYSLLKTGADEYGVPLPLTLKSFGDYKPAMYAYFDVPSTAIFGLNEFGTRLPSALFGIGAVAIVFFLAKRLFVSNAVALTAAFVLAVSPWHIQFSRGAWEANVALTITLLGLLCFLKGLENTKWLFGATICFVLTLYTYQSSRLFVPLLAAGLIIIYRKQLFPLRIVHYFVIVTGIILVIPFVLTALDPQARSRLVVQDMFSYTRPATEIQVLAKEDKLSLNDPKFILFHSQQELWLRAIIEKEINYLSPSYLFVTGDTADARHHPPGIAQGYWIDILFYLVGLYVLIKSQSKHKALIFYWLLIAPIPAVLSRDSTQALRSLQLVFGVDLVIALGLWYLLDRLKSSKLGIIGIIVLTGFFAFNFVYYLDAYYVHMPKRDGRYWLTGYKDAVVSISHSYQHFNKVVFTTDYNEPYIFVLYYLAIDPAEFQVQAKLSATRGLDVGEVQHYNNFEFRHIYWPNDRALPNTLFVGTEDELPETDLLSEPRAQLLKTIKFADGTTAFKIVETK